MYQVCDFCEKRCNGRFCNSDCYDAYLSVIAEHNNDEPNDHILEQQELEDFEQSNEYFGHFDDRDDYYHDPYSDPF